MYGASVCDDFGFVILRSPLVSIACEASKKNCEQNRLCPSSLLRNAQLPPGSSICLSPYLPPHMEPVCKLEFKCLTVTVLLHIVTTFRILIKSPEEGRLGCLKYRENQLSRRFFFAFFFPLQFIRISMVGQRGVVLEEEKSQSSKLAETDATE